MLGAWLAGLHLGVASHGVPLSTSYGCDHFNRLATTLIVIPTITTPNRKESSPCPSAAGRTAPRSAKGRSVGDRDGRARHAERKR